MEKIDIKQLDQVFDTLKIVNEEAPERWNASVLSQLGSNDGIEEFRAMAKLRAIVQNFVVDHEIMHPETIYQTDRVIENAYEFIEDLINVVGYYPNDDE